MPAATPEGGGRRPYIAFAAALLSSVTVILVMGWSGGSLRDPDVWWHVRTGRLILDTHRIPHTDPWSFTAPAHGWVPTAWLSDVAFGGVWRLAGDDGLRVLRIALAVTVVAALWALSRKYAADVVAAGVTCALAVVSVGPFLRERPQVISFLFVAWLAVLVQRVLAGQPPALWSTVGLTYLWANVHGMWVLLPVGLLGASVLAYLDDRARVPLVARCTTIALLGTASTALTPVGPRLTLWPLVVQRTAAPISEWAPTVPTNPLAWAFGTMVVIIIVRWSTAPVRTTRAHVLFVAAVALFALLAFRNLAPATVLLVPELARVMPGRQPSRARTARWLVPTTAVLGLTLAIVRLSTTPVVSADQPTAIAHELAGRTRQLRVLNAYDVGGLLTGTASPPAHVAIDGRTDMWPAAYVRDYIDTLNAQRDWRPLVDRLHPDVAVLPYDSEVARGLEHERGWRVTMRDGNWVLLEPLATR